ncbi:NAD(P)/FAD-dependent oxidoreductase [Gracilibacillus oryzae]|uniref:NAD(P)/FAD-dependent oxidoreductase n=1 Tax=Gracilibacillus oryzae TaxID=1672701 RepID=A0A7C8GSB9_9BACI|nr:NAD(P)/FAD-dependent oxidoreductase [Gracilibacillus oryzae]KAB8130745.1 NAD(P)/FAD-dependent oxidoreductase [Gracilibacillus oryzae]
MVYDCAIIGGGPAGLNAALVLGRARRKVALFDNNQARNSVTQESHGFITRDGVSPAEFREYAHQDIQKYPSVEFESCTIEKIEKQEDHSQLTSNNGKTFSSKKVILAYGLKEDLPDVEGLKDFYGKSVFSCPYCDGWELRDQPLVLIAESEHAVHMAKMIYQWSKDLVICTNGLQIIPDDEAASLKSKGLQIQENKISHLSGTDGKLSKIVFEDGTELHRTGGFVVTELKQPNNLASSLGCELKGNLGIIVDDLGRTNVEGVYAAGETSNIGPAQLIIAAGHGVRAAAGVNYDMTMEEFK